MEHLNQFKKQLSRVRKAVITTHYKPDADALGSSLGLRMYLMKKGIEALVISPSDYPEFLMWMSGNDTVVNFETADREQCRKTIDAADMVFCLDFNALSRINDLGHMVEKAPAKKVIIDHHESPEPFADFIFGDKSYAATAEVVFELIQGLGDEDLINADIAECLYAGIMTDTGQFKHPNTTRNVHLVVSKLINHGADTAKVGRLIYDNNSLNRLRFIGFALCERLVVMDKYRTAFFYISNDDLQRFNSRTGDTEGLVNYGLSLRNIVFSAVIIERSDCVRLSLRSKGSFSVNSFARDHFNGGGHLNAAGGTSSQSLEETVNKFESIVKTYSEQLNTNPQ